MKIILIAMMCLLVMSCSTNIGSNTDVNVKAVVVKINQNEDAMIRHGKYTSPSLCNTALFKNTANNMYFTFSSCGNCLSCGGVNLNDAWVYGHLVGDTVHFTYVNTDRYFFVKTKTSSDTCTKQDNRVNPVSDTDMSIDPSQCDRQFTCK